MPVLEVPELYDEKNVCQEAMVADCMQFYVGDGDDGKVEEDVLLLLVLKV